MEETTGNGMTSTTKAKAYEITKREVYAAWLKVKANAGAGGVDKESVAEFEAKLTRNLYKLWNRMSSGSYFPQAVRRVEIPKRDGSKRGLGIPTVYDRVAQEVVRARLETVLEPLFHEDSYGYRPGKSALEAVGTARERNWKYDWVLDVDIQKFFDTIDHGLLMKAVEKHCSEKWMALYVERWLKAPISYGDGRQEPNESGTPQGGVISPLLANLYLHYAFDKWMERENPEVKFERFADDVIIHCRDEEETRRLKNQLEKRLAECGLKLHPEKTQIVYCKDGNRKKNYPRVSYRFLGYTFRPREARNKSTSEHFTGFLPAASSEAKKELLEKLRRRRLRTMVTCSITEVAAAINPILRGWLNYFRQYGRSTLSGVYLRIERRLLWWARNKHRWNYRRAAKWLARLKVQQPTLFAHWTSPNHSTTFFGRAG